MEKSMTMKAFLSLFGSLLLAGLLFSCGPTGGGDTDPDSTDSTITDDQPNPQPTFQKGPVALFMSGEPPSCIIPEDANLSVGDFATWKINWGKQLSHFPEALDWSGVNSFGVKMSDFVDALNGFPEYHGFRLYFGMNDSNQPICWMAALGKDGSCTPRLGDYMVAFAPRINQTNVCPTQETDTYCGVNTQQDNQLAANWRSYWGVSLTDTLCSNCSGDKSYKIPLAFNVNSQEMLNLINPSADSLYLYLGLKEYDGYYGLRIIFNDADGSQGALSSFVDFAAPCPKQCGSEEDSDPVLGGQ